VSRMRFKIDFHVHTNNSPDAFGSLNEISYFARKRSIDAVVIADHEKYTIDEVKEVDSILFVPAIELRTLVGHVICLLPKKQFDPISAFDDPVGFSHNAGGFAIWVHPCDLSLSKRRKGTIKPDAIEVFNSGSIPFKSSHVKSLKLAESLCLPKVAGSDAHLPKDVGLCYVEIEASSLSQAIAGILKGEGSPYGRPRPTIDLLQLIMARIMKRRS